METEVLVMVISAISVITGSIGTFLIQLMRRDKTESEADINDATAEKIRADAMTMMYSNMAQMSDKIQTQAQKTMDYIQGLDTCKRDIWRLEGENERRSKREKELVDQVNSLTSQVADLTESKIALEAHVEDLMKSSNEKDSQIGLLRDRIRALEDERDQLSEQLEAKESSENGNIGVETDDKTPEIDVEKTVSPPDKGK